MSRNSCENRQIILFRPIFVTRLLCNPAQIADFCATFLHKTGLLCKILSVPFTFWGSLTRNFGAGTRNSEPRNSFFGAWNFFFGARTEKSRYRNFFAAASGPFFFPVGTFSRRRFPCHFVGGIPDGLSRRPGFCAGSVPCSVKRAGLEGIPRHLDFRMARVAAFFPRRPGPAAEYANLRRRK